MLLTKEDLADLWKHLTSTSLDSSCCTQIFVSNNCDALAACKILTTLLQQSSILYTLTPVFSYTSLESHLSPTSLSTSLKTLIFLN
jgi:hypothetical protein